MLRAADLASGMILADRYRLGDKLGEGAMGAVWAAEHVHTRRDVALKVLKHAAPEARTRFLREARAASAARHANVVEVIDLVDLPPDALVMVMERLVGETLGDRVRRSGRLSVAETCALLVPVIDAVGAAHALGIIHRDLKPDNVFVERLPEPFRVKVLDFGVAKLTAADGAAARSQAELTASEGVVGTPYYMSPEQVFSEKDIDARADIWSLGVILYECLAGARPTEAPNVGQVIKRITMVAIPPLASAEPTLPPDLTALVMRMLSRERAERPALDEIRVTLSRHADPDAPEAPARAGGEPELRAAETSADPVVLGRGATDTGGRRRVASLVGLAGVAAVAGIAWLARSGPVGGVATPVSVTTAVTPPAPFASEPRPRVPASFVVPENVEPPHVAASAAASATPNRRAPRASAAPPSRLADAGAPSPSPSTSAPSRTPSYDDIHAL